MKYILVHLFNLVPILIWAQSNLSKVPITVEPLITRTTTVIQAEESEVAALKKELEGTFSVEISRANYQVLYTKDLLETIKTSRKAMDFVRLTWDPYTTIVIFPLGHSPVSISNTSKSD